MGGGAAVGVCYSSSLNIKNFPLLYCDLCKWVGGRGNVPCGRPKAEKNVGGTREGLIRL